MRKARSLDGDYFESLYRSDPDPWRFASSSYEAAKYRASLAALGGERASRGLEIGCSVGVFTRLLASCCNRLVATDLAPSALAQARIRCRDLDNVEFHLARGLHDIWGENFDLIVLSEVIYYWDDEGLDAVAGAIRKSLAPEGRLLLVHWLGETNYPKSADDAVDGLRRRLVGMVRTEVETRTADYRLDLWRCR